MFVHLIRSFPLLCGINRIAPYFYLYVILMMIVFVLPVMSTFFLFTVTAPR